MLTMPRVLNLGIHMPNVCRMYGHSERSGNNLRYKMYRASGGAIPGEKLFPVELPICSMQKSF